MRKGGSVSAGPRASGDHGQTVARGDPAAARRRFIGRTRKASGTVARRHAGYRRRLSEDLVMCSGTKENRCVATDLPYAQPITKVCHMAFLRPAPPSFEFVHAVTASELSERVFIIRQNQADDLFEQVKVGVLLLQPLHITFEVRGVFRSKHDFLQIPRASNISSASAKRDVPRALISRASSSAARDSAFGSP